MSGSDRFKPTLAERAADKRASTGGGQRCKIFKATPFQEQQPSRFGISTSLLGKRTPADHIQKTEATLLGGLEAKTRELYGAGLLHFHLYCDQIGTSEDKRCPASEDLVLAWISVAGAEVVAEGTVRSWISGVKAWHEKEGAPWMTTQTRLAKVLRGIGKVAPASSRKPPRQPISIDHISNLFLSLSPQDPFDVAVLAVASTAFWACCRLGELTVESREKWNPWSKTTSTGGADISPTEMPEEVSCPVQSLRKHLEVNHAIPKEAPFFSYRDPASTAGWSPMVKNVFMARCNEIWGREGGDRVTGHSFRIGGTTELLLRNVPTSVVQKLGRWKSDAFLVYWRRLDSIIPVFIANSSGWSGSDNLRLQEKMASFEKETNVRKG